MPSPPTADPGGLCGPWATITDAQGCGQCSDTDADLLDRMLMVATEFLYAASGRQWPGECEETVRPCRPSWGAYQPWGGFAGMPWGGAAIITGVGHAPLVACGCGGDPYRGQCSCGFLSEIELPRSSVLEVTEVLVDGVVVSPTTYRIDDDHWLVNLDGVWPGCQNMSAATTEPGTFAVTYTYGGAPPASGVTAAASLACELALACAGDSSCRLPKRVQTLTREGVTMALLDPLDLFAAGRSGIAEVDMFLGWANPGKVIRPPAVYAPHRGPLARRTNG